MTARVFKIGGNVVENEEALKRFCADFARVEGPKVLVHGGGVMASSLMRSLGLEPQMVEGRRVTDEESLKVVTMAYAGWCNKHICALLQAEFCNAMGLSGCDGNLIKAGRRAPKLLQDGKTLLDYGFVGDVVKESVNVALIESLMGMGIVPVFCAINHDGNGQLLNTNADTVASSVASALGAELVCCFEMDGVLSDKDDPTSVIPRVGASEFELMKASGAVAGGMIPKIENCLKALREGAVSARICNSSRINDDSGTVVTL